MRRKVRFIPLLLFLIFLACFLFISRLATNHPDTEIEEISDIKLLYKIASDPVYIGENVIEGVCRLENLVQTPETVYIVLEKLDRELLDIIYSKSNGEGGLDEREAKFLAAQIAVVLKHLHSKHIIHHDLKLENILVTKELAFPQVKLCDFHVSEIKRRNLWQRANQHHVVAADIAEEMKSFGLIIYHLLGGPKSFAAKKNVGKHFRNRSLMYPRDSWRKVSKQAIDLIDELLASKPGGSLTMERVINHGWFQDPILFHDLKKLEEKVQVQYLVHEFDRKSVKKIIY